MDGSDSIRTQTNGDHKEGNHICVWGLTLLCVMNNHLSLIRSWVIPSIILTVIVFFLDETFIFTVDMNPWSEEKVRLVAFANSKFSV